MISLSDSELQTILTCAQPIPPEDRSRFLEAVAAELGKHAEIGAGTVGRVVREVQKRYFDPPIFTNHRIGKHGR